MVLLVPTIDSLQDLIIVCEEYAAKHDIVCNLANLNECPLICFDTFKYLALNTDMTDDDIRRQTRQITVVSIALFMKF